MFEQNNQKVLLPRGGGIIRDLSLRAKLVIRLIGDGRVKLLLKLLPIGSLVYLVMFPDLAIGPFDDAAILWLATYLFVDLCPPDVIQQHLDDLVKTERILSQFGAAQPSTKQPWTGGETAPGIEIVDGEVIEAKEQDQ
jgi:hypothetical protein